VKKAHFSPGLDDILKLYLYECQFYLLVGNELGEARSLGLASFPSSRTVAAPENRWFSAARLAIWDPWPRSPA